jgi:hypothetical protein
MTTSLRTRLATALAAFACLVALTFAIQATASGSHAATAAPSVDQGSLRVPAEPQVGSSGDGTGSSGDGSSSFDDGSGSSNDGSGSFDDGSGSFDNGSSSAPTVDPGSGTPRSGTS